jgi:hypothetical protein
MKTLVFGFGLLFVLALPAIAAAITEPIAMPEPSTTLLLLGGLGAIGVLRSRAKS